MALVKPDPLDQLERLSTFIDSFAHCFSRSKQVLIGRQYVEGVLGDATQKTMQGMWKRVSNAVSYQSLQHFITNSTWRAEDVWKSLREKCPSREGVFIIDDTGIAKQGDHSPGVQRQYSGTLGKVGNCQVIVTGVLRATEGIWPLGMQLYLPESWTSDHARRDKASVPQDVAFETKWKIGLNLLDAALADGFTFWCIAADAAYGDCREFREGVRKRGLHYSVGVKSELRVIGASSTKPLPISEVAASMPEESWQEVTWRPGTNGDLSAEFLAIRVQPSAKSLDGQDQEQCWLLCERPVGSSDVRKYHLSSLPEDTDLVDLVWVTHERWAIEHNYKQLKSELGMDDFEGRSYVGLHRHFVLTAIAYYFLEIERQQSDAETLPTLNQLKRIITELFTMLCIANDPRARELMMRILARPRPET